MKHSDFDVNRQVRGADGKLQRIFVYNGLALPAWKDTYEYWWNPLTILFLWMQF
jgi:hypothetical protein